jgi:PAS domain S-box-containing protein
MITIDDVTISMMALIGVRFLASLVFIELFFRRREIKHAVLGLGWLVYMAGPVAGLAAYAATGYADHPLFAYSAALGTFLLIGGLSLYFRSVSHKRLILSGLVLVAAFGVAIWLYPAAGSLLAVLSQIMFILIILGVIAFQRKRFLSLGGSSYYWLFIITIFSLVHAVGFIFIYPGAPFSVRLMLTFLVNLSLIIFFLHFEYHQSHIRLKENEELLKKTQEIAHIGSWKLDIKKDELYWSEEVYKIFGLDPEKPINHDTFKDRVHPDDIENLSAGYEKAWQNHEGYDIVHRIIRPDGEIRFVREKSQDVVDETGEAVFSLGMVHDITEQKEAEAEMLFERNLMRMLLENIPDFINFKDRNRRFVRVSKSVCDSLDCTIDEIVGKTDEDLFLTENAVKMRKDELYVMEAGNPLINYEESAVLAGVERVYSSTKMPWKDEDGNIIGVFGVTRDITERKRAEEEKLALVNQLRQSQKLESIGTLASGVAHEINNPLMGIINYAQIIHDRIQDEELIQFTSGIIEEANRVARIVQNLLAFSSMDKQSHSQAYIEDMINVSFSLIDSLLKSDQITIEQDIQEDLPEIECQSRQIEQVIMNLLTNARDALNSRYEGYHENKVIKISAESVKAKGEKWVRTIVEDHGTGMAPDTIDHIFDPFFTTKSTARYSAAGTNDPLGTGLGLAVSYGIIKEYRGKLSVESELGEYTRFWFDLPVDNA